MAYKSRFTGAQVDNLLLAMQSFTNDFNTAFENSNITGTTILSKITGQQLIDKINSVAGNIVFTKFVDCQLGAGKTV